ncbi:MAG: LLM class flavin-dependent oxidoreductase [Armatimonadota bacterium]|nr:LLM class flavin-dependent oxidoreductase [Armatimonadota bacterium]MDR5703392.1 LLM class flavin-dependent oxidoreductase [Armatimonadota bacterium]
MSRVAFGIRIPDFPVHESRGKQFIDEIRRYLDEVSGAFDAAWISDHFIPWAPFQDPATDTLECWTTLSYLSGAYPHLVVGAIVLCNSYRHPPLVAKMGATLATLNGGRLVLGIGAGWFEEEYRRYGYKFPPASVRIQQLAEAVQIIRRMWTEEAASFEGATYRIHNAYCRPKPPTPPPILIGGGGERLTLRVVAEHADWWNLVGGTPEIFARKLRILEEHCRAVGRDPRAIQKTWATDGLAIAPTMERALQIAAGSPFTRDRIGAIVGDPDEVTKALEQFVALGVEHFILRFVDFPDPAGAKLFAKEVIPRFRQGQRGP